MVTDFKKHLEDIAVEIESLTSQSVHVWVEENVVHIESSNELILTYGGPSITVYLDCSVIKGNHSPFCEPTFVSCNTGVLKDYLDMFGRAMQ